MGDPESLNAGMVFQTSCEVGELRPSGSGGTSAPSVTRLSKEISDLFDLLPILPVPEVEEDPPELFSFLRLPLPRLELVEAELERDAIVEGARTSWEELPLEFILCRFASSFSDRVVWSETEPEREREFEFELERERDLTEADTIDSLMDLASASDRVEKPLSRRMGCPSVALLHLFVGSSFSFAATNPE